MSWEQESLDQYGRYWTFAGGRDVAIHYLGLAKNESSKENFVKEALYYVGFGVSDVETTEDQIQLVVFDKKLMDQQWEAGVPAPSMNLPFRSFQPKWDFLISSYLNNDFQICYNPNKTDTGETVTTAEQCQKRKVVIDQQDVISNIKGMNYTEISGCKEGFPITPDEMMFDKPGDIAKCKTKCSDAYCEMLVNFRYDNFNSTTNCIDSFLAQKDNTFGQNATMLTRAFFEECMSMNPFFTGGGVGWSVAENRTTGTEWIVRGDIASRDVGASQPLVLIPFPKSEITEF